MTGAPYVLRIQGKRSMRPPFHATSGRRRVPAHVAQLPDLVPSFS